MLRKVLWTASPKLTNRLWRLMHVAICKKTVRKLPFFNLAIYRSRAWLFAGRTNKIISLVCNLSLAHVTFCWKNQQKYFLWFFNLSLRTTLRFQSTRTPSLFEIPQKTEISEGVRLLRFHQKLHAFSQDIFGVSCELKNAIDRKNPCYNFLQGCPPG